MSVEDYYFAVRLTDTMNWELSKDDFKFMMELNPDGCFVLLHDSKKVGISTTIRFDNAGWIGNLIVKESYRERGGGSLLVRHSINHLIKKDVQTIGLYSYIDKIPFYKRFGFKYNTELLVLKGEGFPESKLNRACLRKAGKENIQEIVNLDNHCFGASRRKLLEKIILNPDNVCFTSIENKQIIGFVMAKINEQMAEVGPLVCQRGRNIVANNLLKAILNELEGIEVFIFIPKNELSILNLLFKSGFREMFRVARMFYGHPIVKDCIYLAESLERG